MLMPAKKMQKEGDLETAIGEEISLNITSRGVEGYVKYMGEIGGSGLYQYEVAVKLNGRSGKFLINSKYLFNASTLRFILNDVWGDTNTPIRSIIPEEGDGYVEKRVRRYSKVILKKSRAELAESQHITSYHK